MKTKQNGIETSIICGIYTILLSIIICISTVRIIDNQNINKSEIIKIINNKP